MKKQIYLPDSGTVEDAVTLLAEHGAMAAPEASARADRSRNLGNVVHFCRWRQIERLVELLEDDAVEGTLH